MWARRTGNPRPTMRQLLRVHCASLLDGARVGSERRTEFRRWSDLWGAEGGGWWGDEEEGWGGGRSGRPWWWRSRWRCSWAPPSTSASGPASPATPPLPPTTARSSGSPPIPLHLPSFQPPTIYNFVYRSINTNKNGRNQTVFARTSDHTMNGSKCFI